MPEVKQILRDYAGYMDLDKLLLISAYRLEEGIDTGAFKVYIDTPEILQTILSHLKPGASISANLTNRRDGSYLNESIQYSTKNIEECLKRFTKTEYITSAEKTEYITKIRNSQMSLTQLAPEEVEVLFAPEELEQLSNLNEDNFLFAAQRLQWDHSKIMSQMQQLPHSPSNELLQSLLENEQIEPVQLIDLYEQDKISLDDLKAIQVNFDFSEGITPEKLHTYYEQFKKMPQDEQAEKQYQKYLKLYSDLLMNQEDAKEKVGIQIISYMIENVHPKDYRRNLKDFYQDGLLSLKLIAQWNDEKTILEMYDEGKIQFPEIANLAQTMDANFVDNLCMQIITQDNISYEERMQYLEKGLVSQESIIMLYKNGILFDADLQKLVDQGILEEQTVTQLIEERTLEDRIKNAKTRAEGWAEEKIFNISQLEKLHTRKRR